MLKSQKRQVSLASMYGPYPLRQQQWVESLVGEHVVQPFAKWLEFGPQQPGFKLLDHALDGHEGEDFVLAEPKARQLGGVVGFFKSVATQVAVKHDGRVEPVTQFGQVAFEGGR